jgi:hypothetical protein
MKKIFCFLIAIISVINLSAQQAGHLTLTLKAVQCNRETADDILQLDGKGDEVFFNFASIWTNGNGGQKAPLFAKRTKTYGDNQHLHFLTVSMQVVRLIFLVIIKVALKLVIFLTATK